MSRQLPADLLTKPSLSTLAFVLRHRELWPADFEWDYTECAQCALGVGIRLGWLVGSDNLEHVIDSAKAAFAISEDIAESIFCNAEASFPGVRFGEVTPEHVADLIDAHLAREGV